MTLCREVRTSAYSFTSLPGNKGDMTYIDYLNEFNRWIENDHLTLPAQVLYFRLLNVFNRAGWPEWVPVDTIRLQVMTNGLSKPAVYRARDELVKAGFIRYQQGKKGAPSRYALVEIENSGTDSLQKPLQFPLQNPLQKPLQEPLPIYKTKTKNNNPPISPQGFDEFWSCYPRKVGKQAALKAWQKINPSRELTDTILLAVKRQKNCAQWRRDKGQYIPHPATWLNQGRWEDEVEADDYDIIL